MSLPDRAALRALSVDERLALLEELWASLDDEDTAPLSEAHRQVLDERLDQPSPDPLVAWDALYRELRADE